MTIYLRYSKFEHMNRLTYIFLIIVLISGCQNKSKLNEDSKTLIEKDEIPKVHENKPDFVLGSFIKAVDSIFEIQNTELQNLTPINFKNKERRNILAFNQDGLKNVYRYGLFWILEFETPEKSKLSFGEIARLFKKGLEGGNLYETKTKEGYRIMYDVISKGGASFTLKDNFIIEKLGSCSGSFEELVLNEEKMLNYIFRNIKPDSNYYFKYCCACSEKYRMEYK